MSTLYHCDGYSRLVCGACENGKPHEKDEDCCHEAFCPMVQDNVQCMEYDNGLPCNIPDCPDHTGGDGVSCNS